MKVLIVGFGSIGKRHIKNLISIDPHIKIAVLRQNSKTSDLGDLKILVQEVFFDETKALSWQPDAVLVCNPAPFHCASALAFARGDVHLFIEKPLSVITDDIDPLLMECHKRKLVLMVGYVLRFLEPLKQMKLALQEGKIGRVLSIRASVGKYLPHWRPVADYRRSVSARRDLGGGVVFELSHELDYLRWLVGEIKEVQALVEKVSDFDIDVEDTAEINLRFENGAMGNIHLDMIDHAAQRLCRIIGSEGTLVWESTASQSVRLYESRTQRWCELWHQENFDLNQIYIDQLKHFLECIKNSTTPLTTAEDGRRIVEIALAAKRSSYEQRNISL